MIRTHEIERLLGTNRLPEQWSIAQYAKIKGKHPNQCVREVTLKMKKGEVTRVSSFKNGYGKSLGIYEFSEHKNGQSNGAGAVRAGLARDCNCVGEVE